MRKKMPPVGTPEWYDHWLSATWRTSETGAVWINIKGHNVAIIEDYNQGGRWRYRIKDRDGCETWSTCKYDSIEDAKRPALEHLEEMLMP